MILFILLQRCGVEYYIHLQFTYWSKFSVNFFLFFPLCSKGQFLCRDLLKACDCIIWISFESQVKRRLFSQPALRLAAPRFCRSQQSDWFLEIDYVIAAWRASPEERGTANERLVFSPQDQFSLSLEYNSKPQWVQNFYNPFIKVDKNSFLAVSNFFIFKLVL